MDVSILVLMDCSLNHRADRADQESYVCECGEKVLVKESIDTSWWDGIEWVICPECGERKKR